MSDDEGKPGGEFDRMSLNSLKRELANQHAKTDQLREDAQDRKVARADATKKSPPWGKFAIILGVTGALVVGLFVLGRSMLPEMQDWGLPAFIAPELVDGGPAAVFVDPPPARDAGFDAGRRRRHHSGHGSKNRPGGQMGLGNLGDDNDPIGGI